jgi:hypothetical protein
VRLRRQSGYSNVTLALLHERFTLRTPHVVHDAIGGQSLNRCRSFCCRMVAIIALATCKHKD